jgi:deazaflavin-dependent oxidoreductase (nitroreductase family)
MGLAAELSYVVPSPNVAQRTVQRFASTRGGAWLFSKILAPLDRHAARLTRGRALLPDLLAGLPALELTSTGRRSGQARKTHLIAVPVDDTLALLGTNFGQATTPAWVLNLEAEPRARVEFRGVAREVVAQPATPAEHARVLELAGSVYAGYPKYAQRISGRRVRIFLLAPG